MSKEVENEDGSKETLYTAAEIEAAKTEAIAPLTKTVEESKAEIDRLSKLNIDKTANFKKYNELTEAERAAYSENDLIQIKRNDALETELGTLKETLAQKEQREKDSAKISAITRFAGDKAEIKTAIEEKYALLAGMPETTPEQISARTTAAAHLAGISLDSRVPIYQHFDGAAPEYKKNDDFTETDKGKEQVEMLRESLGIPKKK